MSKLQFEPKWVQDVEKHLKGRRIVLIRYMTHEEKKKLNIHYRPIILQLDNGKILYPMSDTEGNDAGVLFTNIDDLKVIPDL